MDMNRFESPSALLKDILNRCKISPFEDPQRLNGDRATVDSVLRVFGLFQRKLAQLVDVNESILQVFKDTQFEAHYLMLLERIHTNLKRRIGIKTGVEIGDIFFYNAELLLLGLHFSTIPIDCLCIWSDGADVPIAHSILVPDGNSTFEKKDGLTLSKKVVKNDPEHERFHNALMGSYDRKHDVRVTRVVENVPSSTGAVYVYDGLYKLVDHRIGICQEDPAGYDIFRYTLARSPGQPAASKKMWGIIQKWKDGTASRLNSLLSDLSLGTEKIPVSLVNEVDEESDIGDFTYSPILINHLKPFIKMPPPIEGCACNGLCLPSNQNCGCIQKNKKGKDGRGYLPHLLNGLLVQQKHLIYECGPSCTCPPDCPNRVSQHGLRVHLEVFRTPDKAWGLRSWDPIQEGAFVCEYAGELVEGFSTAPLLEIEGEENLIFKGHNLRFPLIIDARKVGNVARFIRRSGSPNLICQQVLRGNDNVFDFHIMFYASRHIPPMTELTFNYGMIPSEKEWERY